MAKQHRVVLTNFRQRAAKDCFLARMASTACCAAPRPRTNFSVRDSPPVDKLNNCDSSSRASPRHPGRGSVPLGTPIEVLHSFRGGDGPNILRGGRSEKAGVIQGGGNPLGCVLCLLSVALQKVGASAARAGERKEIDSPREGWVPTGCGRPNWLTRFFARRPGSRLGGENPSKTPSGCSWRQRN